MAHDDERILEEPDELEIEDEAEEDLEQKEGDAEEAPDRGDVVIAPDAEDEEAEGEEASEESESEDEEAEADDKENTIPVGRFTEVNLRMKKAEAELVRRDEEDIARGVRNQAALQEQEAEQEEEDPVDIDKLWDDYGESNERGAFDEASEKMAEIRKAERTENQKMVAQAIREDRVAQKLKSEEKAARETANELKKLHPDLLDTESDTYQQYTIFADGLYSSGIPMSDALQVAADRFFGEVKAKEEVEEEEEKAEDTAASRKRAAILRNAKAAKQQPPRLDKGTGQGAAKADSQKKIKDMSESEFDAMSDKDKDRGDKV